MIFIHIEWCIAFDCFHFMPKMCFGGFKVAVLNVQYPLPAMSKTHVTYTQVKHNCNSTEKWECPQEAHPAWENSSLGFIEAVHQPSFLVWLSALYMSHKNQMVFDKAAYPPPAVECMSSFIVHLRGPKHQVMSLSVENIFSVSLHTYTNVYLFVWHYVLHAFWSCRQIHYKQLSKCNECQCLAFKKRQFVCNCFVMCF